MSVIVRNNRWPSNRVPYEIVGETKAAEWFRQLNDCVGHQLLVPRLASDVSYVRYTVGGYSKSETIGFKGGMQTIGGTDKHTVMHELLHALGFQHEQLHKGFPWDDNNPKRTDNGKNRMFSYKGKISGSGKNLALYKQIMLLGAKGSTQEEQEKSGLFYADNNLASRCVMVNDPTIEHFGQYDLHSVMNYGDFPKAVRLAGLEQAATVISSGKSNVCDVLSNQDVLALVHMYPPPPPPVRVPYRPFEVSFEGSVNDSLMLKFSVRAAHNSSQEEQFTADAEGTALVRGFDPRNAEIRVHPWPYWSRLSFEAPSALPGGRYMYSVRLL
ncbi:zinc metalloprotease [Paraburkholderia kirstenboschensis]|uniref:Peptidase M12A domain-containing protein n=1 Tax=Paraburkholderia kirstenboschensis TaxID=1245436 RepID=A0ABZ0EG28_9BURK|nr:hypothetical protein [Paraburkholderia kirstenboschensis]WOD15885.1 hypothetical protein RW095_21895 [Paraburkholderia kirstenboschensis]